jgi:hypothetical protein
MIRGFHLKIMLINLDPFRTAETLDQLNQYFKAICNEHGIERFALVEILRCERGKQTPINVYTTYTDVWVKRYITKKYYEFDTVYTNPIEVQLPFYWDNKSFKNMTLQQRQLFIDANNFGIISGTTIPLMPNKKTSSYLTILNLNLTDNFEIMFWLRTAGNMYFNAQNKILNLAKNDLSQVRGV